MFVSKRRLNLVKERYKEEFDKNHELEIENNKLLRDLKSSNKEISDLRTKTGILTRRLNHCEYIVETSIKECKHKFNKWEQSRIKGSNKTGDNPYCNNYVYYPIQVRKCKRCGFMESKEI